MRGSPLPFLPMVALSRAGLWKQAPTSEGAETTAWPAIYEVDLPGLVATVTQDSFSADLAITFATEAGTVEARIPVTYNRLFFGVRRYFMCPCCTRATISIIVHDGHLYCREGFVRNAPNGKKALGKALVLEAVQAVHDLKPCARRIAILPDGDRQNLTPATARRRSRDDNARIDIEQPHPMSTEAGWKQGFGSGQYEAFCSYKTNDIAETFEDGVQREIAPPKGAGLTTSYPGLGIRFLRERHYLRESKLLTHTLRWGTHDDPHGHILLIADYRGWGPFLAIAHQPFDQSCYDWQFVDIKHAADGRWRFVCPVRRVGCDFLYLRDGSFASREAQRLYHPSQRAAGRKPPVSN